LINNYDGIGIRTILDWCRMEGMRKSFLLFFTNGFLGLLCWHCQSISINGLDPDLALGAEAV
jgi:hypothetical protein